MLKREWKPWYPKHRGPAEPDRTILEMAVARELLATWAVIKDKALVDKHLAAVDKRYGAGAEQRVRQHMREIHRNECHG